MTDEKHEPDEAEEPEDPTLLPDREAMSVIAPTGGLGGILPIGPEPAALPDDQTLPSVESPST
jgi:hypothetical protein